MPANWWAKRRFRREQIRVTPNRGCCRRERRPSLPIRTRTRRFPDTKGFRKADVTPARTRDLRDPDLLLVRGGQLRQLGRQPTEVLGELLVAEAGSVLIDHGGVGCRMPEPRL